MKTKTNMFKKMIFVLALMTGALSLFSFMSIGAGAAMLNATDVPGEISAATGGQSDLRSLVLTIVNYALGFLGILAVMMIIYGGFTYVASAGNEDDVGNAKKMIKFALIGIIIILLSFVIVNAILGAASSGV